MRRLFLVMSGVLVLGAGCGDSHSTDDPTVDGGRTDMRTPPGDGGGGVACGSAVCTGGQVCCNESCGICADPGEGCITLECVDDMGPCMPPPCPAPPDGCRYEGGSCDSCGELVCDDFCGGFRGGTCDATSYCDYDGGCGFDDGGGTCEPRPEVCTDDCPGVCGCDGNDYCNACMAASMGVDVLRDGACDGPPPPRGDCGGFAGLTCPAGQWCDYGGCPGPDALGSCEPVPEGCFDIYDPVCGCDGMTYGNECEAQGAGMNYRRRGECGRDA